MEEYQQRVIEEKADIAEKVCKLERFIDESDDHAISQAEQQRLGIQLNVMRAYGLILQQRIDAFYLPPQVKDAA